MIEITSNARLRDAYRAAHQERSEVVGRFFARLMGGKSSV